MAIMIHLSVQSKNYAEARYKEVQKYEKRKNKEQFNNKKPEASL